MTLLSPWAKHIDFDDPLNEYPRMQLQRGSFTSLNGIWEFMITDGSEPDRNDNWSHIVVPFALGSKLSGTDRNLMPGETLWMRKSFDYTPKDHTVVLNFEAVDQSCVVYLNGFEVGRHVGGYTPFSMDVSQVIKSSNELLVKITDDTDQGLCAYGKQKISHGGMFYTPSAGIWQTVWLEDLPAYAVTDIKLTPDYDNKAVYVRLAGTYTQVVVTVFAGDELVHRGITNKQDYTITLKEIHAWSPSDPFLYTLYLQTEEETVKSYFAMRKFGSSRDARGNVRFTLNGEPLFLSGLLDQGYSVDGLMTYPSEDAMRYELKKVKEMGFNMLRKHVKVECRRWYYLCDVYGILVMQDIPNGGGPIDKLHNMVLPTIGYRTYSDSNYEVLGRPNEEQRNAYYRELLMILDTLYNVPCIFAWVPFNEGWGQFDSAEVTSAIMKYDTTRLVDSASGWHDNGAGDFNSRHCYFRRFRAPRPDDRIMLLSEFGGYTYYEQGHSEPEKLYGYKQFRDKAKWNEAVLEAFARDVLKNIPKGLSGAIYTQLSDVEDECNGLFSADRRVLKIDERKIRRLNERCYRSVK